MKTIKHRDNLELGYTDLPSRGSTISWLTEFGSCFKTLFSFLSQNNHNNNKPVIKKPATSVRHEAEKYGHIVKCDILFFSPHLINSNKDSSSFAASQPLTSASRSNSADSGFGPGLCFVDGNGQTVLQRQHHFCASLSH